MTYFKYQVRTAVTWQIVSELYRRHGGRCNLEILETHPGGGMYDCISLFERTPIGEPFGRHICDFNQYSQHFHIFDRYQTTGQTLGTLDLPEKDYVHAFLSSEDPSLFIDSIGAALGFPAPDPIQESLRPSALRFLVMAELAGRYILAQEKLDLRWGVVDTSGYCGSRVREDLWRAPEIRAQRDTQRTDQSERNDQSIAFRYWLLGTRPSVDWECQSFDFAIGDDAQLHILPTGETWDLWQQFVGDGHTVPQIANTLLDLRSYL